MVQAALRNMKLLHVSLAWRQWHFKIQRRKAILRSLKNIQLSSQKRSLEESFTLWQHQASLLAHKIRIIMGSLAKIRYKVSSLHPLHTTYLCLGCTAQSRWTMAKHSYCFKDLLARFSPYREWLWRFCWNEVDFANDYQQGAMFYIMFGNCPLAMDYSHNYLGFLNFSSKLFLLDVSGGITSHVKFDFKKVSWTTKILLRV